ncbi:hypothetical protein CLV94_2216 [Flavobacterium endophyticum]|uniref:Uncharacterized protein n=1 Tax=Flavobacterium endophyticum TaxID=1540163 RepID=A0A495MG63_9FLAO|nr:hypothetical protein [Flavobacterium endophyticum]RKS23309.1 hypothetical protein CLV94_2216 [Flavobacterium endophyticum]
MKRITFAISTVGLLISGYALPGRFADDSTDMVSLSLKGGFILLFICSFIVNGYCIMDYFRRRRNFGRKRHYGIRTIRQYYHHPQRTIR